jgi:hypothetical protein
MNANLRSEYDKADRLGVLAVKLLKRRARAVEEIAVAEMAQ